MIKFEPLRFYRKAFNIRHGEELRSFLMFSYIFLIISTLMIIKPVCNSLFLSFIGASRLPIVYILVALFAAAVSYLYSKLLRRVDLNQLIIGTFQVVLASMFTFWTLLYVKFLNSYILYAFEIWVAIYAVISVSQFWIFANIIFNTREAKRMFGFIGAGAIAGGIFGGYLTKILAPVLGSENLLLVCMVFILLCILITVRLWREHKINLDANAFLPSEQVEAVVDSPLKAIKNSRHLTLLAFILGISVVVAKLVDYQFSAVSSAKITDEDQLTAFFGFWLSNLNIISLLIQLFITRHIIGTLGVSTSLFFLPFGILIGAVAVLANPALWSATLIKVSDGSLKNSINKAGMELLLLPIPLKLKNQARSFIDVFGDSFATGIGGILLFVLTLVFAVPVRYISFISILLISVWLYLVIQAKKEYVQAFRSKIKLPKLKTQAAQVDFNNQSILDSLIQILNGQDEKQILNTLKLVSDIQSDRLIPCFEKLIRHPSAAIRHEVLQNVSYYKNINFEAQAKKLIWDDTHDVKIEAINYLFQHATDNGIETLQLYLHHDNYFIRQAALLCAARESRNNREYQKAFKIREIVEDTIVDIPQISNSSINKFTRVNCAKVIGAANIPELYFYLHILMTDDHPEVIKAAITSAGQTRNKEFIPSLLKKLGEPQFHRSALQALVSFGPEIIDILTYFLNNPIEDREVRSRIPRIISSIGIQKSVQVLIRNIGHEDLLIRQEVIRALYRLRKRYPELTVDENQVVKGIVREARAYIQALTFLFTELKAMRGPTPEKSLNRQLVTKARQLLIKELEKRLDANLERIFRMLGLIHPPDDIYNVYLGMLSQRYSLRTNALEFLDNVLSVNLKRLIIPIVETTMIESSIERTLRHFGTKIDSETDCLVKLLADNDFDIKACTLFLMRELKNDQFIPYIRELTQSDEPTIRETAQSSLAYMGV